MSAVTLGESPKPPAQAVTLAETPKAHPLRPATRVGHITYEGARFCGRGVFDELLGEVRSTDELAALALGLRVDAAGLDVLRICAVALLSPDARVWPLKTVRVLGSYGNPVAAFYGGQLVSSGAMMGPGAVGAAAAALTEIAARGADPDDRVAVEAATLAYLATHDRVAGFGVPFRAEDERLVALRAAIAGLPAARGRSFRLHVQIGEIVSAHRGAPPNLAFGVAALLVDLGLPARRAGFAVSLLMRPSFAAHALEAADHDAPWLRELPAESLEYRGAAPRRMDGVPRREGREGAKG